MPSPEFIAWASLIVALVAAFFTALQWASAYRSAAEAKRSADAAEKLALEAEHTRLIQANAIKAQAEDTRITLAAAERSAIAAEKSATAAEMTARNAALSLESQRASLAVETIDAVLHGLSLVPTAVEICLKNTGGSTATDLYAIHIVELRQGWPSDLAAGTYAPSGPAIVGAGLKYEMRREINLADAESDELVNFRVSLYTYGRVWYRDFLGKREFTFCYYYHVKEQRWEPMGLYNKQV